MAIIKEATGIDNINEVISKMAVKDETIENLTYLK